MTISTRQLKLWVPFLLFIVITLFLWQGLKQDPHKIPSVLIGKPVPTFNASALYHPQQTVNAQLFQGHISLLNVFATWCLSCYSEHSVIMNIKHSKQLKIYGLNYKDGRDIALKWLAKYGNPYDKVIYDPEGQLGIDLGVYGTPETFIVDAKKIIRYKHIGPISHQDWQDKLLPIIQKLQREQL